LLDEVMDLLPTADRDAVLLYYFEGRSFADVGAALSLSADAARMRVNRALERVRSGFAKRGIVSSAAALGAVLSSQSTIAAPPALARLVVGQALSQAHAVGSASTFIARVMSLGKSPAVIPWAGAALTVGVLVSVLVLRNSAAGEHGIATAEPAAIARPGQTADRVVGQEVAATGVSSAAPVQSEPRAGVTSSAVAVPSVTRGPGDGRFEQLSEEEKNLLSLLWREQLNVPVPRPPGMRLGLKVGEEAPNFPGVDRLLRRGMIRVSLQNGMIFLSPAGELFCERHHLEIEAHEFSTPQPRVVTGPPAKKL
jgi:hypothetical protein